VLSLKTPTANALIDQVKAAWDRADEKKADADDWYIRTGKLLIELKEGPAGRHGQWLKTLKKIGRSRQRADELMEQAEDPGALERQRDRKRDHARKVANRRYSGTLPEPVEAEPTDDEGQTPEDQWQNSLANLCGDVLAMQSYWDKHFKGWKHFKCPSHIKTLAREAATELTSLTTAVTGR
jgi:hypothetical protein